MSSPVSEIAVLQRPNAPDLVYQRDLGVAPYLVFLPGFNSNMFGRKAEFLRAFAATRGLGFVRFDYRGHGDSSGRLADGNIERWYEDALAVIDACTDTALILVGASMGTWISLLIARANPARVHSVVGLGGAPDSTSLLFESLDAEARAALRRDGIAYRSSRYGDGPYPVTPAMVEAGERSAVLSGGWALDCPLRLLHGMNDPDVPWEHAIRTAESIEGDDMQVILLKHGDHRLSDPPHLRALGSCLTELLADT